uniref:Core Histone H2A/H2B/H3 domain-containing protein n=1 Tax=Anopheles epiroticus TaxID=199890 RepID=A0A182PQC9_9DIPT
MARASRSRSRQLSSDSSSSEGDEREEQEASQRNRRSQSSTRSHTPETSASSSQRRSLSADPPRSRANAAPQSRNQGHRRIAPFLKEMLHLQQTWHLLIPKAAFGRVVREVFDNRFRITTEALRALHESSEVFLVQLFEDAYKCCMHRARVTLSPMDIRLVIDLRGGIK